MMLSLAFVIIELPYFGFHRRCLNRIARRVFSIAAMKRYRSTIKPPLLAIGYRPSAALRSTGGGPDLSPSGLALPFDRVHVRRLRPEFGYCTCEVEGEAVATDAKNHPRMRRGQRFWLVGWVRVRKGRRLAWRTHLTIPRVGVRADPGDLCLAPS